MSTQVLPSQDAFASRAPLAPKGGHKNTGWAGAHPSYAPSIQTEASKKVDQAAKQGFSAAHPRSAGHHLHPAHVVPPQRTRSPSPGYSAQAAAHPHPTYAAPVAPSAGRGRSKEVTPKTASKSHPRALKGKEPLNIQSGYPNDTSSLRGETSDTIREPKHPKQFYVDADSKVAKCTWTVLSPRKDYREYSIIITNLILPILKAQVEQPLRTVLGLKEGQPVPPPPKEINPALADQIYKGVIVPLMQKLPRADEKIDPDWKEEARKHAVNIAKALFPNESLYLARTLQALKKVSSKDSMAQVFSNPNSLAVALACEADRAFTPIVEREFREVEALFKKQVHENPEATLNAVAKTLASVTVK